jgi:hypothetical protein
LTRRTGLPSPRGVREAAGVAASTEFVVLVEAPGRIVLSTREAITAELHAMFAPLRAADPRPAEQLIRELRDEDALAEEEKWQRMAEGA